MILLDTSGLLAALDPAQRDHERAADALRNAAPPLLLSPFILAELDHLVGERAGRAAQLDLLAEVASGAYCLESFTADDVAEAREIVVRHADLTLGLADASIVVLAERYGLYEVLTLDERHFRTLRGSRNRPFKLLPADA